MRRELAEQIYQKAHTNWSYEEGIKAIEDLLAVGECLQKCRGCGADMRNNSALPLCHSCLNAARPTPQASSEIRERVQAILDKWDDGKNNYRGRVILLELKACAGSLAPRSSKKELRAKYRPRVTDVL